MKYFYSKFINTSSFFILLFYFHKKCKWKELRKESSQLLFGVFKQIFLSEKKANKSGRKLLIKLLLQFINPTRKNFRLLHSSFVDDWILFERCFNNQKLFSLNYIKKMIRISLIFIILSLFLTTEGIFQIFFLLPSLSLYIKIGAAGNVSPPTPSLPL